MKAKDFLKLAGVKNEQQFYEKFPTEEAFFNAYPDAIQYKKGGKIKYNPQYREFPPNVMEGGGFISPYAEMGLNTDNPSKGKPRVMSAGENVGWTIADIVTSPISSFTGKNLSELASNKVNPYNRKQGSWWGGIEATYVKPAVQGGLADSGIPFVSQVAGMGKGVRENVAPALINEDDDANRLGIQNGMGSMGSSIGGGVSGMMGSFGGSKMMKQGGKLMYNNDPSKSYENWKKENNLQETEDYDLKRAFELGYFPDEKGHLPSVDYTNGVWLKSKNHPTAWMEYQSGALNPDLSKQTVIQNEQGKLQYVQKKQYNNGGNLMEGMGLNELGGPTHEQGGMGISPQTEVEGGETVMEAENYVFSDSILVPGKKVSFAKESKAIKNKYKLRPNDKLSKESMDNELNALMGSQEKTKAALMQQEEQKFIGKMNKKYGGLISFDRNMQPVEMWGGGTIGTDPITGQPFNMNVDYAQPNPALNIKATSLNPEDYIVGDLFNEPVTSDIVNPPEIIGTTYNRGLMPENYQYASTPYVKQSDEYTEDFTAGTLPKVNSFNSNSEFNPKAVGSGPIDPTKNKLEFDPNSIKVPNSAIAALAAGLKGGGKQKLRLTPRMKFNYLNTRPAEILAERQGELGLAAGLNTLKDNAGTQGNFIANTVNMAANAGAATGKNVADIRFQGDVQNLGLSNQEAQATQALARENNMLSTQFDTANLLRRDKTLDDMSRITQSQQVDNEKRKQETMLLEMMSKGIVKWNPKGGGYLIKSVDELTGEETWVPYKTLLG